MGGLNREARYADTPVCMQKTQDGIRRLRQALIGPCQTLIDSSHKLPMLNSFSLFGIVNWSSDSERAVAEHRPRRPESRGYRAAASSDVFLELFQRIIEIRHQLNSRHRPDQEDGRASAKRPNQRRASSGGAAASFATGLPSPLVISHSSPRRAPSIKSSRRALASASVTVC